MATTVGKTLADFLNVELGCGLGGTSIAIEVLLLAGLFAQLRAGRYIPWLYWLTVVIVSVIGALIIDNLTDTLDISLFVTTGVFSVALAAIFASEHALSVHTITTSGAFLNRIDAIACTAEAIIGGDLARRMPVRGTGDDLNRLAGTLNRMLDQTGRLMDSLRQVSSDVAHDLRTPLTRLYQRFEDKQAHGRSLPEYKLAVDAALAEAERLLKTFSALLRIAQAEGASPRAGFRDVDLSTVAESVAMPTVQTLRTLATVWARTSPKTSRCVATRNC